MQRADEHDLVVRLQYIFPLALKLPISVIDEHEDAGAAEGVRRGQSDSGWVENERYRDIVVGEVWVGMEWVEASLHQRASL